MLPRRSVGEIGHWSFPAVFYMNFCIKLTGSCPRLCSKKDNLFNLKKGYFYIVTVAYSSLPCAGQKHILRAKYAFATIYIIL